MNDNELRELFGEMREEAVPAESLARVRMAVAERMRRHRLQPVWKLAVLLAVAGCLAVVMLRVRTVAPVQPVPEAPVIAVERTAPVEASPPPVVREPVRVVAKPVRAVQKTPVVSPDAGGASEIRIESPLEPDVVIVLLGG